MVESLGFSLLRLLNDLHDAPVLLLGERACLHDFDRVSDSTGIVLVVRLELLGSAHRLAIERMPDDLIDRHDDGLVHLIAHYAADASLAASPRRDDRFGRRYCV